jgi:Transposase zinc-binding domain
MARPSLEVADIFRGHGVAWRDANRGHVSLDQLKVMNAIESCRTEALGGHIARCEDCAHTAIAYNNSCRNLLCITLDAATGIRLADATSDRFSRSELSYRSAREHKRHSICGDSGNSL